MSENIKLTTDSETKQVFVYGVIDGIILLLVAMKLRDYFFTKREKQDEAW